MSHVTPTSSYRWPAKPNTLQTTQSTGETKQKGQVRAFVWTIVQLELSPLLSARVIEGPKVKAEPGAVLPTVESSYWSVSQDAKAKTSRSRCDGFLMYRTESWQIPARTCRSKSTFIWMSMPRRSPQCCHGSPPGPKIAPGEHRNKTSEGHHKHVKKMFVAEDKKMLCHMFIQAFMSIIHVKKKHLNSIFKTSIIDYRL